MSWQFWKGRVSSCLLSMVGDELTHAVSWQVSVCGGLAPDGLTYMSGAFPGMSGPPLLHALAHSQERQPSFSHQSAVFQESDNPWAWKSYNVTSSMLLWSK